MKKGDKVYVAEFTSKLYTHNFKLLEGTIRSVGKATFKVDTSKVTFTFRISDFNDKLERKPLSAVFCAAATAENKQKIEAWVTQAKTEYEIKHKARLQEEAQRKLELEAAREAYLQKYGKPEYISLGKNKILFTKLFDVAEFPGHSFFVALTITDYEQNFLGVDTASFTSFGSGPTSQTITPEHVFLPEDCSVEELLTNAVVYIHRARLRDARYKFKERVKVNNARKD